MDGLAQPVRLAPDVVVDTSGPFQGQSYWVAQACISAGIHYIDLSDSGEFVAGISSLDAAARKAGVLVIGGASSVPALSSAAVDSLAEGMLELSLIDIGISPGNKTERGLSTIKAVTSYCGKPLPGAGLAPEFLHRAMLVMAWMTQRGWVRDWSKHALSLKRAADLFRRFGSDAGAMHVSVTGVDRSGKRIERTWQLLALDGDGVYVPTLAAAALVRLTFSLCERAGSLDLSLTGMHVLGIPCSQWLVPQAIARESGELASFRFQVQASLGWAGVVVQYEGMMNLPDEALS